MLNTIKGLLEGNNKKAKTVDAAQKELDKLTVAESELQGKRSGVATQISEVERALGIISANLIIDENDKQALVSKDKGTKKLENLQKELSELDSKIAETQQKKLEANKEVYRSQGEEARKNNVEVAKQIRVIGGINNFFGIDSHSPHSVRGVHKQDIDLSEAYGLGDFQRINPVDQSFVIDANSEDNTKGEKEAKEIVKEVFEAMKNVLDKHSIELTDETVKRIENL
ncbi:hypothetical protein ABEV81_10390 [Bacillus paranthracis]|uniref:hypothetical protein n=1 Tax=Bacillus paranthracis TaxID=2026186 RepID=UPI003F6CF339